MKQTLKWVSILTWGAMIMTVDKRVNKKTGEELQQYLAFRRRGTKVESKKGRGSYNRRDFKKGL